MKNKYTSSIFTFLKFKEHNFYLKFATNKGIYCLIDPYSLNLKNIFQAKDSGMKMKDSKKKKTYFSFLQKGKSKKTQKVVTHQSFI